MEAVSENEAPLLRDVLHPHQNVPSQAAVVVLGGDSRRASTHCPWRTMRRTRKSPSACQSAATASAPNRPRPPRADAPARVASSARRVQPSIAAGAGRGLAVASVALRVAQQRHRHFRDWHRRQPCRLPGRAPARSARNGRGCARSAPALCRHAAIVCGQDAPEREGQRIGGGSASGWS